VDGAIHRAAGSELLDECRSLNGCSTGEAKITKGYKLKAKYVIHTVGPVWNGGEGNENELLANCYKNCFRIAHEHELRSIAFPAISTGVYRFPVDRACEIALNEASHFLKEYDKIEEVLFVCFDELNYETYNNQLEKTKI